MPTSCARNGGVILPSSRGAAGFETSTATTCSAFEPHDTQTIRPLGSTERGRAGPPTGRRAILRPWTTSIVTTSWRPESVINACLPFGAAAGERGSVERATRAPGPVEARRDVTHDELRPVDDRDRTLHGVTDDAGDARDGLDAARPRERVDGTQHLAGGELDDHHA